MQRQTSISRDNGKPDRIKSKSSLSLLWEEYSGEPIDLHGYIENCWNTMKIVDINIDQSKSMEQLDLKLHFKDSGHSSLNDEEQNSVSESDSGNHKKSQILKTITGQCSPFSMSDQIDGTTDKWNLVVKELIDTESLYLASLEEVEDGYLKCYDCQLINAKDMEIIFCNWKQLRHFHSQFLRHLRIASLDGFNGLIKLSKCFLDVVDQFESLYCEYCTNFTRSINHLGIIESESNDLWYHLIECQNKLGHQLPLSTFLLKPVQRILKYQLLLQELIHGCSATKGPYVTDVVDSLLKALEKMLSVASTINMRQTEQEELSRQIQLRDRLCAELSNTITDYTEFGRPCLDGELKVSGCRNMRVVLLCEHALLLAKKLPAGRWSVKQMIRCKTMMLFEYIPKQPLSFHIVDIENSNNKVTLQAMDLESKEMWCRTIKQLILETFDATIISDKKKQILLDKKQNVLAMNHRIDKSPTVSCDMDRDSEEDLLDLETSLREILEPKAEATQAPPILTKPFVKKNQNSEMQNLNYKDPSIYQRKTNRTLNQPDKIDDVDCRSITIEVNEELLQENSLEPSSVLLQTYERYIKMSRNKIHLTAADINEIFQPLRHMRQLSNESNVPLAEIELASICSDIDCDSIESDPPSLNASGRHRKTASMDRTFGMNLQIKANSMVTNLDANNAKIADDKFNYSQFKKPLFSSVRGTKTTRSRSEWSTSIDAEVKPGLVRSLSKLFRGTSKLTKRDKTKPGHETLKKENLTSFKTDDSNRVLNKSNSTDHISKTHLSSKSSFYSKKSNPQLASDTVSEQSNISESLDFQIATTSSENYSDIPLKPPRKMSHSRIEPFDKCKSSSSDGLRRDPNISSPVLSSGSVSETGTPYRVKNLVSIFQK